MVTAYAGLVRDSRPLGTQPNERPAEDEPLRRERRDERERERPRERAISTTISRKALNRFLRIYAGDNSSFDRSCYLSYRNFWPKNHKL